MSGIVVRRPALTVFVIAVAVRVTVVLLSKGGPLGSTGYDGGVYYAAADALTFGRLPYADFVLLHPPGLMLTLTPFAAFGRLTSDHIGFVTANLSFNALGALNAALVVIVARRLGLPRHAQLVGGCFYALWQGAIAAELGIRLEPLGSLLFLLALLLFLSSEDGTRRRLLVGTGAALGAAVSVKIWWAVPALVLSSWPLVARRDRRSTALIAAGCAGALVLIDGPFALLARGRMWDLVVVDQLGRPRRGSVPSRLESLSLVSVLGLPPRSVVGLLLLAVALLAAAAVVVSAWSVPAARPVVAIALAQLTVLLAVPTFFGYYSDYVAAAAALVLATAAGVRAPPHPHRAAVQRTAAAVAITAVVAVSADTAGAVASGRLSGTVPFPGTELAEGVEHVHCLMADAPIALIELDALSRDFAHRCADWVDVTGRTYGIDRVPGELARTTNRRWQADIRRYLLSGNAVMIVRALTGLSPATRDAITDEPVLESRDGQVVYAVTLPPERAAAEDGPYAVQLRGERDRARALAVDRPRPGAATG
jgi:hypothetical protein